MSSFGAGGPSGSPLRLTSGTAAIEPSWNADGTELTYVDRTSGTGTVEIVAADGKSPPQAVASGADYHRPVFAPVPGSSVLAFTRWTGGTERALPPRPRASRRHALMHDADDPNCSTAPTWSPDGTSIAVLAENPGNPPTTAGVLVYSTYDSPSRRSPRRLESRPGPTCRPRHPTADPTFLAYSPLNAGTSSSLRRGQLHLPHPGPRHDAGTKVFDYTAPPAFAWRTDGVLVRGRPGLLDGAAGDRHGRPSRGP